MKKLIRNNKAKNSILDALKGFNSDSIHRVSKEKNIDLDLCFVCVDELEKSEYITTLNTSTRDGQGFLLNITRRGCLFLKDGGYPSSGIRIIKQAIITNKATIISVIALIVSILSYLKK